MGSSFVGLYVIIALFSQHLGLLADELGGHIHILVLLSCINNQMSQVVGDGFFLAQRANDAIPSF